MEQGVVRTVQDDRPGPFAVDDTCEMLQAYQSDHASNEHKAMRKTHNVNFSSLVRREALVHREEFIPEVWTAISIYNPETTTSRRHTFADGRVVIWPFAVRCHEVGQLHTSVELSLEKINLVEEEDNAGVAEELVGANGSPEK